MTTNQTNIIIDGLQEVTTYNIAVRAFDLAGNNSGESSPIQVTTNDGPDPLPVTLLSFNARVTGQGISLYWATSSEINNDRFEIERSVDGTDFQKIGEVPGNGDSREVINYDYVDNFPPLGRIYYRLRQVDIDGAFEYSKVLAIDNDQYSESLEVMLYPNPSDGSEIHLRATSKNRESRIHVQVLNTMGVVVFDQNFDPDQLNGGKLETQKVLAPGLYIFNVQQGDTAIQQKLVVR